jgi:hypothetical protein
MRHAAAARGALVAACWLAAGCASHPTRPAPPSTYARVVTVEVRDRSGAPAAGADVLLDFDPFYGTGQSVSATTDADGLVQDALEPGDWIVYAQGGSDVAGGSFVVRDGRAAPPADTALVRLRLDAPGAARGHAFLAGRTDHSGILVLSLVVPDFYTTAADGAWLLGRMPPGRWTVILFRDGFEPGLIDAVIPAAGDTATTSDVTLVSSP